MGGSGTTLGGPTRPPSEVFWRLGAHPPSPLPEGASPSGLPLRTAQQQTGRTWWAGRVIVEGVLLYNPHTVAFSGLGGASWRHL